MAATASSSTLPPNAAASSSTSPSSFPTKAPLAGTSKTMSGDQVVLGLREALAKAGSRAVIVPRDDERFRESTLIFNGAVKSPAFAAVKPRSAADVSEYVLPPPVWGGADARIVKFCRSNGLDLSVKAGGTGVHGWSVMGHIVIDVSLLNDVSVSLPDAAPSLHETFQSLRIDDSARSPTGSKRTFDDASDTVDSQGRGKRRGELNGNGGGNTSDDSGSNGSGSRSRDDAAMAESTSSLDPSRTGSSSTGRFSGTPNSSVPDGLSLKMSGVGADGSISPLPDARNRTTYVNPSPTASSILPFVSHASANHSLVLNTNPDPPPYTIVTFGAGVDSKQLDMTTAASPYGAYHVPTSAFPVGAGQFLLGGFGFLGRKHGLAMDNLVEAEVVLADGRIVWVGENGKHSGEWKEGESPEEMWWALRGAGPILGVVTRFRAKAYYLPSVFAGNFIYVFDHATTPSLLRHVRDCVKGSPRTLYANIIMTAGPPGAPAIVVIQLCFSGKRQEGETYVQAISSWEGGRCLFQDFSERTFERQQLAVEEILKGGKTRKWYIKSDMIKSLTDEVIEETCGRFHTVPDGCTWLFEFTGGGAQSDVEDSCFPQSHRQGQFTVAALHQWGHFESPAEDKHCIMTAESWITEVIHPNSPGGPLPCFLQASTEADIRGTFAENYPRLAALKKCVDPDNFFKHSMWPPQTSPFEDGSAFDGEALSEESEKVEVDAAQCIVQA